MTQFLPSSPELLAAVAGVLDALTPTAPEHLRHEARVAAHLTRLVARELELELDEVADTAPAALDDTLDDVTRWEALVAITRRDLAVVKPGYDAWEHG